MIVKEKSNIVQANHLIENRPNFTKDETRLFLTIIASINKDDEDFKPLHIPVSEFAELWGIGTNDIYERLKQAIIGLRSKGFVLEDTNPKTGKRRFLTAGTISVGAYEEGAGYATVEISPIFKPYLLALKNNYTKYTLSNIMQLTTVNAIRNYELFKQYESLGCRTFSVDEYRKILGIEDKYPDNTDLRRYVIEPAIAEINEKTDLLVKYHTSGRGKRTELRFDIKRRKFEAGTVDSTVQMKSKKKQIVFSYADGREEILELEADEVLSFHPEIGALVIEKCDPNPITNNEELQGQTSFFDTVPAENPEPDQEMYDQTLREHFDFFRAALNSKETFTDAKMDELLNIAKKSEFGSAITMQLFDYDYDMALFEYLKAQDRYTAAKKPKHYYSYLKTAIRDNYAKYPIPTLENSSFDIDEFNHRGDPLPIYQKRN